MSHQKTFCFPTSDPSENLIVDDRTDSKKVADILRIWSQVLTPAEAEIWSDIAERDVTKDISLRSGLRTPKAMIDNEIKMFTDITNKEKCKMTELVQKLPLMPSVEPELVTNQDSSPTSPLLFSSNRMPNLNHLNSDFIANYGSLMPDSYQMQSEGQTGPSDQPVIQVHAEGKPSPSDKEIKIQDLAEECAKEVQFLRQQNKYPKRLHILLKNKPNFYSSLCFCSIINVSYVNACLVYFVNLIAVKS